MKYLVIITALVLGADAGPFILSQPPLFNGKQWAVLVAGSNGYDNYRHQADVYHSYQVLRNHGIPEENIIVFHYDDIAMNEENPTKGIVINKPGGQDVYKGVPKDYTGEDVTPKNFLGALTGDKELEQKGKKVLKSGPNDHVFIYFADHGAPDLIAFPSEYLYGEDLNKALEKMNTNKMYSKLVFYLEACESGSMFATLLPKNINIYATTAANPSESSYACYYDEKRGTYLGDLYSVNWIENSDKKSLGSETLLQQFNIVKSETNLSHVQEYGELSMASLPLTQFQGDKQSENQLIGEDERHVVKDSVDSGEVPLFILINKIRDTTDPTLKKKYTDELVQLAKGRQFLYEHLRDYLNDIRSLTGVIEDADTLLNIRSNVNSDSFQRFCYRTLVDTFNHRCLNLNEHPYVMRKLHVFVNVCQRLFNVVNVEAAKERLEDYCQQHLNEGYPTRIK